MKRALFLDLDHTVIRPKSGGIFPKDAEDWEWMPGIIDCLKAEIAAAEGWQNATIILVTNQGGVLKGHQTEGEVEAKLRRIRKELGEAVGCTIHSYAAYKNDYDRKPLPGMAYKAALEFGLDLAESTMVGDLPSDREFAIIANIGRFVDTKNYLPRAEEFALKERPGCPNYDKCPKIHHCDCWHEDGMPIRNFGTGLAPVAYKKQVPVFTPGRLDHNPIG